MPASGCLGRGFNRTAGLRMASVLLDARALCGDVGEREKNKNGRGNNMGGGWHQVQKPMG